MSASSVKRQSQVVLGAPPMTPKQFSLFQKLIYQHAGIRIQENKGSLISTRLARRLRVLQISSWDEYGSLLQSGNSDEIREFVNSLTTNKTEFFREVAHFNYLRDQFLPQRMKKKDEMFFWIAAASYGQEVYSLAMLLEEKKILSKDMPQYRILASDIDTEVLEIAETGVYDKELVERDVPAQLARKYFLETDDPAQLLIDPSLKSHVKFRQHNLTDTSKQVPLKFDVIMLRNVLIYFDPPTVERVITYMHRQLKTDGVLILGHCESIIDDIWDWESPASSVYIKRGA